MKIYIIKPSQAVVAYAIINLPSLLVIISLVADLLIVDLSITDQLMPRILTLIICLSMTVLFRLLYLNYYIMIDEQGIKLKFVRQQRTMRWDEIKHVGIKVFHYTNKSVKCIFFSTDDIPMPDKVKWYGASVDNKIFIPTRKKIMETVELYWHEPIEGIEKLSKARSNKANPTKRPASTGESGMKFNTYKLSWLVLFTLFLSFPFCLLAIYVFISGPPMLGLFFVSLPLAFSALCYLFYLVNRIIIDEQGVQYVKSGTMHRVSWDEIKHVGIGYVSNKILKKKPWIYFSSENVSMPSLRLTKDKYIKIAYRKNAVEIIRNYWHNPINGLNDLSEFEKTMKKL